MDPKSTHSLEQTQNATEECDKENQCVFEEVHQKLPQKLEASNESFTDTSATENEEFASCISFKDLKKSDSVLATSNTHCNKDANKILSCQLSKSETDCLNHLNDMIASASGNNFVCNGNNSDECLVERVCYELKSNSTSSREDLSAETSYKSHLTTIQSSGISLESSQTDDGINNSSISHTLKKSTDNVELNIEADTVSDLNMSEVHDRIEATFDECLYKVNDACDIKACSQHEMNGTININLNKNKSETKTETEATNNVVDKVTVSQDQMENTHIVVEHDDSVNDMKAIVCQVFRTWAERQSANTNKRRPHASVSHGIERTQNVTNVREYVKKIEGSFTEPSIKDNSKNNKNELYTNILQKVLAEDDSEHVQEVREETLQLMNETDNEEQWKEKFHEILHMFQELANKMKISHPNSNRHGKCFNYMKGPTEDTKFSFETENNQDEILSVSTTMNRKSMESIGAQRVCNTRNVAEQTELPTQASFCCQVSLFAFTLENEVQTDESISTTTLITTRNKNDDEEDASDTLIHLPNSMSEDSIPFRDLNTEGSGLSLTKVSGSQMELLSASYRSAPCESNFHTIHIEADSSPASSVLQRQPLCTRFWKVVKEFCMATCFCIQVNKDCIFCIAFFVIFVICSSLLTAFFYRTLHADSTLLHHPLMRFPTVQSSDMSNYKI